MSIGRINKYLNTEEIDPNSVAHDPVGGAVMLRNASFTWGQIGSTFPLLRWVFRMQNCLLGDIPIVVLYIHTKYLHTHDCNFTVYC